MIDLPRGYKVVRKEKKNGEVYSSVSVKLNTPKRYREMSRLDVEYINDYCIKPEDCIFLTKGVRGHIYITAFDVQEKKIDQKKFIEKVPGRFNQIIRIYKNKEC
ncbi:MAG: hypothetical protein Q8M92_01155 [Candidatus Subteraquimicrobiales bacterium]|nr:hypothetical protein [Candidatus Subteraquimicrobiales bacterium]